LEDEADQFLKELENEKQNKKKKKKTPKKKEAASVHKKENKQLTQHPDNEISIKPKPKTKKKEQSGGQPKNAKKPMESIQKETTNGNGEDPGGWEVVTKTKKSKRPSITEATTETEVTHTVDEEKLVIPNSQPNPLEQVNSSNFELAPKQTISSPQRAWSISMQPSKPQHDIQTNNQTREDQLDANVEVLDKAWKILQQFPNINHTLAKQLEEFRQLTGHFGAVSIFLCSLSSSIIHSFQSDSSTSIHIGHPL
jgi:hypothetical protein